MFASVLVHVKHRSSSSLVKRTEGVTSPLPSLMSRNTKSRTLGFVEGGTCKGLCVVWLCVF